MANIDPDVSGAPASPVTPLMGRSALANELRRLPARLRRTLELRNWVIDTIDVAISTFVVFTDPHEERSLDERFDWLQSQVQGGDEGEDSSEFDGDLADLTAKLNAFAETELPRWVKRLSRDGHWKRFARKLLGSGSYDRLAGALLADCAAIAGGLRDIVRIAQPFAVAFDDVLKVLTPQQIQTVDNTYDWAAISALRLLLQIDQAMGRYIDSKFDWKAIAFEQTLGDNSELADVIERLRPIAAGQRAKGLRRSTPNSRGKYLAPTTLLRCPLTECRRLHIPW